jgi:hypothetical protein
MGNKLKADWVLLAGIDACQIKIRPEPKHYFNTFLNT